MKTTMKKISKITLTADNGVFKDLIQEIIHNRELGKFKIIFSANIVETKIIITKKDHKESISNDWHKLLQFLNENTVNLKFTQIIE